MGRVKELYQALIDAKTLKVYHESVPIEYTMSAFELEELEFLSDMKIINTELQILTNSDKADNEIT
jgi:hypothetical protein